MGFKTQITFGTHSTKTESRITLGWIDDQLLDSISIGLRWRIFGIKTREIVWNDLNIGRYNSLAWHIFNRKSIRTSWGDFSIPHILIPLDDGIIKELPLNFCPLIELRALIDISNFPNSELNYIIEEEVDMMYGEIRNVIFPEEDAAINSGFRNSEIAYGLAKVYVLHRVAMKLYFLKYPMAEFGLKIQGWVDLYKEAISALKTYFANIESSKVVVRPMWAAPSQLIIEKGVGGVGEGIIDIKNMQKNKRYSR